MVHPDRFAGKVVVVTGAAQGLGEAVATRAAREGAAVACVDRSDLVHEVAGKLAAEGAQTIALTTDLERYLGASTAMAAARNRFGRIDVLINNAANFWGGFFEELTPGQIADQLTTGLLGPMNVTRAVLPVMRRQRSGHIMSISSGAGLAGFEFNTAYCAAKFGMEGWMEALTPEIAPFGISTTIINPGFFRTDLLTPESANYPESTIPDYAERHAERVQWYADMNGHQEGDPAKLARALLTIADEPQPPRRFIALTAILDIAEQKAQDLRDQADAYRDLSSSLALDTA